MDADRFAQALAALQRLLDADVPDLSSVSDDLRSDGLPHDWIPDIATLTSDQRLDMLRAMDGHSHDWCEALRDEII